MIDRLRSLVDQSIEGERKPQIGRIVNKEDGTYWVIVNGRATPRKATAGNEFLFNGTGHGDGDEVILVTSELNDTPVIAGHSPWLVNQIGTAYDA